VPQPCPAEVKQLNKSKGGSGMVRPASSTACLGVLRLRKKRLLWLCGRNLASNGGNRSVSNRLEVLSWEGAFVLSAPKVVQQIYLVKIGYLLEKDMLVPLHHTCWHPGSHPEPRPPGTPQSRCWPQGLQKCWRKCKPRSSRKTLPPLFSRQELLFFGCYTCKDFCGIWHSGAGS